jgi:hypothetical protein
MENVIIPDVYRNDIPKLMGLPPITLEAFNFIQVILLNNGFTSPYLRFSLRTGIGRTEDHGRILERFLNEQEIDFELDSDPEARDIDLKPLPIILGERYTMVGAGQCIIYGLPKRKLCFQGECEQYALDTNQRHLNIIKNFMPQLYLGCEIEITPSHLRRGKLKAIVTDDMF